MGASRGARDWRLRGHHPHAGSALRYYLDGMAEVVAGHSFAASPTPEECQGEAWVLVCPCEEHMREPSLGEDVAEARHSVHGCPLAGIARHACDPAWWITVPLLGGRRALRRLSAQLLLRGLRPSILWCLSCVAMRLRGLALPRGLQCHAVTRAPSASGAAVALPRMCDPMRLRCFGAVPTDYLASPLVVPAETDTTQL